MRRKTVFIFTFIIAALFTCTSDGTFSEAKNLSEFPNTQFNPTLEDEISKNKNAVYCATLLFAWDEVRKQIHKPLSISSEQTELSFLNNSKSFLRVLNFSEYEVFGEINGELITARAEFSKALPFEFNLNSYENRLIFDGKKVASFGVTGYDSYELLKSVELIYYKNDENFILKLLPKDQDHEIILFKSDINFSSMAEVAKEIEKWTEVGKKEKKDEQYRWKYYFKDEDVVIIPKINFNIETNYTDLEGSTFKVGKENYTIESAWQRTAFSLDEKGAEIESLAEIEVALEEELDKPKPKKMIFDSPFLVLLKRVDAANPYFGLWATNTELMVRE